MRRVNTSSKQSQVRRTKKRAKRFYFTPSTSYSSDTTRLLQCWPGSASCVDSTVCAGEIIYHKQQQHNECKIPRKQSISRRRSHRVASLNAIWIEWQKFRAISILSNSFFQCSASSSSLSAFFVLWNSMSGRSISTFWNQRRHQIDSTSSTHRRRRKRVLAIYKRECRLSCLHQNDDAAAIKLQRVTQSAQRSGRQHGESGEWEEGEKKW